MRRDLYLLYVIPIASNGPEFPFLVLDLLSIILSYPKAHHSNLGLARLACQCNHRSKMGKELRAERRTAAKLAVLG